MAVTEDNAFSLISSVAAIFNDSRMPFSDSNFQAADAMLYGISSEKSDI